MLKNNYVDIYQAEEGIKVKEIVKSYQQHQLVAIEKPTRLAKKSQFAEANM